MSDVKLLPCPFCGGEAERIDVPATEDEGENAGGSCIQCSRCVASTALHFDRKENLVSSWNQRVIAAGWGSIDAAAARIAALEEALREAEPLLEAYSCQTQVSHIATDAETVTGRIRALLEHRL